MPRASRLRRVTKWGAGALSAALAVSWAVSVWWGVRINLRPAPVEIWLAAGEVSFGYLEMEELRREQILWVFSAHPESPNPSYPWYYAWGVRPPRAWNMPGFTRGFALPHWLLLLSPLILTAFLFYRDRRTPPGHCQHCGYDLTGNVSGRCPECGEAV